MSKHYFVAVGFVVITGCVASGISSFSHSEPTSGLTHSNFERVHLGMTMAEVEAILGTEGKIKSENPSNIQNWSMIGGAGGKVLTATFEFSEGRVFHKSWSEDSHYTY